MSARITLYHDPSLMDRFNPTPPPTACLGPLSLSTLADAVAPSHSVAPSFFSQPHDLSSTSTSAALVLSLLDHTTLSATASWSRACFLSFLRLVLNNATVSFLTSRRGRMSSSDGFSGSGPQKGPAFTPFQNGTQPFGKLSPPLHSPQETFSCG